MRDPILDTPMLDLHVTHTHHSSVDTFNYFIARSRTYASDRRITTDGATAVTSGNVLERLQFFYMYALWSLQ